MEVRLSDDGQLVLARQTKSDPWRILTLHAEHTGSGEVPTTTRARDLARRLERDLIDVYGTPFDWRSRDQHGWLSFRSGRGETFEHALERLR
ncbi:hypothetical protein ABZ897_60335 [Nonomuraea sp. NPDC046802]|uniref:hypothetical protein n=1 Tax=Nonomuraea sp. NPDC046802 TaxID=3154919 RepID=UPI00340473E1